MVGGTKLLADYAMIVDVGGNAKLLSSTLAVDALVYRPLSSCVQHECAAG